MYSACYFMFSTLNVWDTGSGLPLYLLKLTINTHHDILILVNYELYIAYEFQI